MSSYDDGELLMATQQSAINEVRELLEKNNNLPIDDGKIIEMLEITDYDPNSAYQLLASEPLELNKTISDRTRSHRIDPLTNRTRKSTESNNNRSAASTQSNKNTTEKSNHKSKKNKTRKNRIVEAQEYVEKQDLESKLPEYLNGANVDIIERDGHCFFRSITHQLRDYGFAVPDEYQTVRDLIANYIDREITLETITAESPTYTTKKAYTDAIRKSLWGGTLEIQAVHDGCLNSLTNEPDLKPNDQAFKIIVYSVIDDEIKLHPGFLHTMPNGEEEHLIERWPIRLIYVGNNHFHRIYFDNLDKQKKHYVEETVRSGITQSPNSMWSPRNELSPSEIEEQKQAFAQFNKGRKIVEIDENSDEYLELLRKNLEMPFMVMGYQNGEPNILYETKVFDSYFRGPIEIISADIYIPSEFDKDNRQFTRYPNPTMLNIDGKTIINISLHNWANIWDDDNNIPLAEEGKKSLNISMPHYYGVEEVIGTEDADFTSISVKEKSVPYMRHGKYGMSFSPDTGVIAINDNIWGNPECTLYVTDPTDNRELILNLNFKRYKLSEGGKSRSRRRITRKLRRNKRRQTKHRH